MKKYCFRCRRKREVTRIIDKNEGPLKHIVWICNYCQKPMKHEKSVIA